MCITRYLLGHGLLCAVGMYELHPQKAVALLLRHGCVCWVSHERREYSVFGCCGCRASQERISASAAP